MIKPKIGLKKMQKKKDQPNPICLFLPRKCAIRKANKSAKINKAPIIKKLVRVYVYDLLYNHFWQHQTIGKLNTQGQKQARV